MDSGEIQYSDCGEATEKEIVEKIKNNRKKTITPEQMEAKAKELDDSVAFFLPNL